MLHVSQNCFLPCLSIAVILNAICDDACIAVISPLIPSTNPLEDLASDTTVMRIVMLFSGVSSEL